MQRSEDIAFDTYSVDKKKKKVTSPKNSVIDAEE
jgi:hypothetical protein